MLLKWIQSVLTTPHEAAKEGSAPVSRNLARSKDPELLDIIHEAMRVDANELDQLLNIGQPNIERKKQKERIKVKVKKAVAKEFDDSDLLEEVTERIADAAEFDPYYKDLFDEKG